MSRWRQSKAWPIFRERRLLTFSSDQLKPRKFQSCVQRRTAVGVYPIVYITHGIGVPFRKEGYALCYHIYTSLA